MYLPNPSAVLSVDLLFTWYSKIAHIECRCRLRIYRITFDKFIVIVSELPNNLGLTITQEALTLIHLVCNKFSLVPTKTMWLEHYLKTYFKNEEIYYQVVLLKDNTWSKRINKRTIDNLLGVEL